VCVRRTIRLSRRGLPASLSVGAVELLAAPVQLRLHADGGGGGGTREMRWAPSGAPAFSRTASGGVEWISSGALSAGEMGAVPEDCRGEGPNRR